MYPLLERARTMPGVVPVRTHDKDKYGRTIADVILPDGTNVNSALVKEGWCWWYRKYAPVDSTLEKLEAEARETQRILWADPHPVPPWEWMKKK
jgi:endonuclease YncB( thermonuclease family)